MKFNVLYQAALNRIERVILFVATALLGLLLLNETFGILIDFFGYPIPWISEVSVLLFVWVVFLGTAILARYGGHVALDLITFRVPPKCGFCLRVLTVILALIVAVVMVYHGVKIAVFVGERQTSLYLHISLLYFYLAVPVSGLFLGLNYIGWLLYEPSSDKEAERLDKIRENPLY